MTEERFMIAQPVRSLQYMLGQLSYDFDALPFLAPDGVFGEETLEAVMVFQREFSLPVTGRVDQATWDAVVLHYLALERSRARPLPLSAIPAPPFQIFPEEDSETLRLTQTMFHSLSQHLEGILPDTPDGHHGAASVHNTRWLQNCSGMEENGTMDRFTWNMLARLYALFVARYGEFAIVHK